MRPDRLSAYEEQVLQELVAWKSPTRTLLGRAGDRVERLINAVMDHIPLRLIEGVLGWVMPRLRDLTWRGTSEGLTLRVYRRAGVPISSLAEVPGLDLEVVDAAAGDKRLQEGAVAGVQGAAAGFFGGWTLAADVAGVMLLSMRAVQSRALVYGFDPSSDQELAFVLKVLDAASRLGPNSKTAARSGLSMASRALTRPAVKRAIEEALERVPKSLTARFVAMKSESVAPVLGAATSATFNAWYLQAVSETARQAYRERFLRRKHGDELLAAFGL